MYWDGVGERPKSMTFTLPRRLGRDVPSHPDAETFSPPPDPQAMVFSQSNKDWSDQLVRVYIDGMGYFQGIAAEVSSTAILVDFPVTHAPALIASQEIALAFSSSRRESSLKFEATVVYRGEDKYRCRLRFEIGHETQMALTTLIEARGEYRVSANTRRPITVAIYNGSDRMFVESVLENFSTLGLSLIVRSEEVELLTPQGQLKLAFKVHGDPDPYSMDGILRYSRPQGAFQQLGVEIVPSSDPVIRDSLERFQRYVRKCQGRVLAQLAMTQDSDQCAGSPPW